MSDIARHDTDLSVEEQRALLGQLLRQKASRPKTFPLSFAQERLWFLDQLEPGTPAYNMRSAFRLSGRLNVAVLEKSLNEVVRRHGSLRTTFAVVDGQPVQVIAPTLTLPLPVVDLRTLPELSRKLEMRRLAAAAARQSFDLARGPLWQVLLLHLTDEDHALLLTIHHIISDGWSLGILFREISTLYEAFANGQSSPLPELPIQYADYAVWQRQQLQGEILEKHITYWKRQLAGAPVLELPTDRPRPAVQTFRGARQPLVLSASLSQRLQALSQREGVTLFMTLLAAFAVLLSRYSGQDDISVGTFIANRNRPEVEGLIGFFINNLVLRTDLSGDPRFLELLRRVREVTLGAYAHQDVPFEKLLEELQPERDLSRTPLFQVMLVLQNAPTSALGLSGTKLERAWAEQKHRSNFDLTWWMYEGRAGLSGSLEYNADLFEAATVRRMVRHLETLLEGIAANPAQRLSELPLLTEPERQQLLVEWGSGRMGEWENGRMGDTAAALPLSHSPILPFLFEAQVERTPEAVAVVWEEEQVSYRELNRRANQVAHYLRRLGVGPEGRVGICLERSVEMVIGLLGILKAGGAYLPLDPAYPPERLAWLVADAQAPVVLTQQRLLERLPIQNPKSKIQNLQLVCLDRDREVIAQASHENPDSGVRAENVAYVIYTSGSTGQPKGVMVEHRSVASYSETARQVYGLTVGDRVLQFASLNFDASAEEIYPCLSGGATLVLRTEAMVGSFSLFLERCRMWGLTVLDLPTVYWHELTTSLAAGAGTWPESVRLVIIGGECALARSLSQWQAHVDTGVRLVNTYGPTEATVVATMCECAKGAEAERHRREVPIGRPIRSVQAYVLDRHGQPMPIGVPGELHLGGTGVARGYLGRPELTAEKFIAHSFSTEPGSRLYKTGDIVRYRPDGQLEFVGRVDDQVKVRGFRIELGEIETALRQHPAVQEVVVVAREDEPGDRRLVAYVVVKQPVAPTVSEWHSFLKAKLPAYMIPSAFVVLEQLPLGPTGKLDRRALPAPGRPELEKFYVAPRTELERFLVTLWQEVLGIESIGVHDNFFELGGNSLRGAVMVNRLQAALGAYVYVVAIFEAPTIAELARYLNEHYRDAVTRRFGAVADDGRESRSGTARGDQAGRVDAAKVATLRQLIKPLPGHARSRASVSQNPPAIFILSPPRSGSTLLRVMLGGHPRLFAPPELNLLQFSTLKQRKAAQLQGGFWDGPVRAIMEIKGCDADQAIRLLEAAEREPLTTQQFYRRLQTWLGDRVLVDKTIAYALNVETLQRAEQYFEQAQYIHLLRHPYGMIRSFEAVRLDRILFRRGHPFTVRQLAEIVWLICHENILAFLAPVEAQRQYRVKFEDLVREPRAVMEGICAWLGLEFHPDMVRPYQDTERKMTDGIHPGSRMIGDVKFHEHSDINATVAEQWREYYQEDFLGDITWQMAESLGYERISQLAFEASGAESAGQALAPIQSISRSKTKMAKQLLAKLDQLSDEEVDALLSDRATKRG